MAHMRKVTLKVVNGMGQPVQAGEPQTEKDVIYRQVLSVMAARPINGGLCYDELVLCRKLEKAPDVGCVYLTQNEMDALICKVKQPFITQYNSVFFDMVQSIIDSPLVEVTELVEEVPENVEE